EGSSIFGRVRVQEERVSTTSQVLQQGVAEDVDGEDSTTSMTGTFSGATGDHDGAETSRTDPTPTTAVNDGATSVPLAAPS
ncbi:unnamed protein product, partial [Amoebophrya sp. A120]